MLGMAFLAGTLVFTDTIRRTFDDLFASIFEQTESYVRSTTEIVDADWGDGQRGRMPESTLVATSAAVPGVADAQALVAGLRAARRTPRERRSGIPAKGRRRWG